MAAHCTLRALGAAALVLASLGCPATEPDIEDTGFRVAAVVPLDDDQAVVESANPELRVTAYADPVSCDTDSVRLVAVADGNSVVRDIDYELSFPDNGRKIRIEPSGTLATGYWYMITLRSGDWGCTDTNGRVIAPFASSFYVP
jgi:hypothetical protein